MANEKSQSSTQSEKLQHEGKMPLKERMEESQAYGEQFRAEHSGADVREAALPTATPKLNSDESKGGRDEKH